MRFSLWEIEREESLVHDERRSITDPSLFPSRVRASRGDVAATYLHTHVMPVLHHPPRNIANVRGQEFRGRKTRAKDIPRFIDPLQISLLVLHATWRCVLLIRRCWTTLTTEADRVYLFGSMDRKLRAQIERLIHRDTDRAFSSRIFADSWKFDRVNVRLCRMLERFFRFKSLQ